MKTIEVQGHTVPHWKALRYGKDESRGLSYDSTLSICQDVLKSGNLLHKWGSVDSLMYTTVLKKCLAARLHGKFGLEFQVYRTPES